MRSEKILITVIIINLQGLIKMPYSKTWNIDYLGIDFCLASGSKIDSYWLLTNKEFQKVCTR